MEGAAAADGGAGADYLASLMFGVLKRMLDRGAFVVSNEDLQNKPLLYMTPRLLHVLVAEECMKTHGVYVINKIVEGALEAAFLEALGPRGIKPLRSLHHHARGRKHGIFVNVRPACIPSSWFGNKHEDLPAGLKQSALLKETMQVFANMASRSAASTLHKPKPKPGAPSLQAVKRPRHAPDWGTAQVAAGKTDEPSGSLTGIASFTHAQAALPLAPATATTEPAVASAIAAPPPSAPFSLPGISCAASCMLAGGYGGSRSGSSSGGLEVLQFQNDDGPVVGVAGGRGPLVKARLMGHLQSGIVDARQTARQALLGEMHREGYPPELNLFAVGVAPQGETAAPNITVSPLGFGSCLGSFLTCGSRYGLVGVFLPPSPTAAKNDTVLPAYRRKRVASEIEARVASFPRDALCGIDPAALPFLVVTTQEDMDAALQLWENEARGLVAGVPALVPMADGGGRVTMEVCTTSLFISPVAGEVGATSPLPLGVKDDGEGGQVGVVMQPVEIIWKEVGPDEYPTLICVDSDVTLSTMRSFQVGYLRLLVRQRVLPILFPPVPCRPTRPRAR